jgi:hypothetical protein
MDGTPPVGETSAAVADALDHVGPRLKRARTDNLGHPDAAEPAGHRRM